MKSHIPKILALQRQVQHSSKPLPKFPHPFRVVAALCIRVDVHGLVCMPILVECMDTIVWPSVQAALMKAAPDPH